MSPKQKILIVLLSVLAVALVYRLANPFRQATVDRLTYAPARSVTAEQAQKLGKPQNTILLDLLQTPAEPSVVVRRDLFGKPSAARPDSVDNQIPPQPILPPRPKSAVEQVREHLQRFKTFGSFKHGSSRYLFLERGKQVLVVTKGDRIDGKYEVLEVAEKSVTISTEDYEEPIKIDFDEL